MKSRIFLQSEVLEDVAVLQVDSTCGSKRLREVCMSKLPAEVDHSEFHLFVEDNDDEQSLEGLSQIPEVLRVHLHRLKGIDVTVRYAGRDVRRAFRPSATVGRVKDWAAAELGIPPSDAAELMLQISGTNVRPDADVHIGSLVQSPNRAISFDLIPSPRVNG